MDNEDITTDELMEYMPGPDFPTGGLVINKSELPGIYETGTGKIKLRGKVVFEAASKKGEKDRLVITEIPYTMIGANIGKFISDIVELVETKKTTDIVDVSNESSKEGIRIVLELKKNADVRMVDCVGYIVKGALGIFDGEDTKMVHTPWFDYDIPFEDAAEIGTRKVITDHSTIGFLITTDGSITGINRDDYLDAEERVVS